MHNRNIEAVTIGGSAGSIKVLVNILSDLPILRVPIFITIHRHKESDSSITDFFNRTTQMSVKEGEDKEPIKSGTVYFAPASYHMMVDEDKLISLSVDSPVTYAIPSIDVTFESIANIYRNKAVGILLTGANEDGTNGLKIIREYGGICIAQTPNEAEVPFMPQNAIDKAQIDYIYSTKQIKNFLLNFKDTMHEG